MRETRPRKNGHRRPGPGYAVPRSAVPGIRWPAVPALRDANVLALLGQLEQREWWSPETLVAHQLRQLENLLAHAARTVPFYGERLDVLAPLRRGQLTREAWRRIPIMTRGDVQDAGENLMSRDLPKDHGRVSDGSTSGSTGQPISFKTTRITGLFFAALNLRYHLWHGRDFSAKVAKITRLSNADSVGKPHNWVPGHVSGPMVFFGANSTVAEQVAWLRDEDPQYLLTYPSNLRAILGRCRDENIELPGLLGVSTMGEVVEDEVRRACEEVFGFPLSDVYSAQEIGMIALQCPDHLHYHVQSESVLVEILNDDSAPCGPGETGRLVLTDLHNFASPLIRYEIGDYAKFGEPCSCGRGLPVLSCILGRKRNMATLPSGDLIRPLFDSDNLNQAAPVRQAQLVQRSLDAYELRVVVTRKVKAKEEEQLRKMVLDRFGYPMTLDIVYVDEIPRLPSGKFEDFMSEIDG